MIQGYTLKRREQPAGAPEKQPVEKIFVADVLFGSPEKNCAGAGICKVITPVAQELYAEQRWGCNRAVALVRIKSPKVLVFQFVIESMCQKAIRKYFTGDVFVVESPFEFHQDYWSEKGRKAIKPGIYPVARSEGFLSITFNL